jgi:Mrp family chromosome partitioning ATPase
MRRLMRDLSDRYHDRVVIFDSPPLLATSEAKVLATLVGQVVVVVEAWKTQQSFLKLALDSLDKTKITGLVLNKNRKPEGHSYYYYGYGNE